MNDVKQTDKPARSKSTQMIADYVPLVVFFISYKFFDIFTATASLIVTSSIAVLYVYLKEKRVAILPTVTAGLVLVFGSLTLILQDENLIKLKSTIIMCLFALILIGSAILKKPVLKFVFKDYIQLTADGWQKLSWHYGAVFALIAVLNEFVRRTQTTDMWVNFKVFGITVIFVIFGIFQAWRLRDTLSVDAGKD